MMEESREFVLKVSTLPLAHSEARALIIFAHNRCRNLSRPEVLDSLRRWGDTLTSLTTVLPPGSARSGAVVEEEEEEEAAMSTLTMATLTWTRGTTWTEVFLNPHCAKFPLSSLLTFCRYPR